MSAIVLDACGIVNLYASDKFSSILKALRVECYLPSAVERESLYYRQPDPSDPDKLIPVSIDLTGAIGNGLLRRCDCENEAEMQLYVDLASRIGDDGESMGLAIAKCRSWSVLTDDKKARKIAEELGIVALDTTEVMKQWHEFEKPSPEELSTTLQAIERFANFTPGRRAANLDWWVKSVMRS